MNMGCHLKKQKLFLFIIDRGLKTGKPHLTDMQLDQWTN